MRSSIARLALIALRDPRVKRAVADVVADATRRGTLRAIQEAAIAGVRQASRRSPDMPLRGPTG